MTTVADPRLEEVARRLWRHPSTGGRQSPLAGWLFLGPALLLFLVFILGPFVAAMALSFYSYDLLTPAQFVGLDNFKALRTDELLLKSAAATPSSSRSPRLSPTSSAGCCSPWRSTGD